MAQLAVAKPVARPAVAKPVARPAVAKLAARPVAVIQAAALPLHHHPLRLLPLPILRMLSRRRPRIQCLRVEVNKWSLAKPAWACSLC